MPNLLDAQPSPLPFDASSTALLIIDMQRDFLEPGGFGESLGNDVSLLASAVPPTRATRMGWNSLPAPMARASVTARSAGSIAAASHAGIAARALRASASSERDAAGSLSHFFATASSSYGTSSRT